MVSESLPKPVASDKRALLNDLLRLNQVRRLVMHPVRGGVHSDDAFEFLRGLKASVGILIAGLAASRSAAVAVVTHVHQAPANESHRFLRQWVCTAVSPLTTAFRPQAWERRGAGQVVNADLRSSPAAMRSGPRTCARESTSPNRLTLETG